MSSSNRKCLLIGFCMPKDRDSYLFMEAVERAAMFINKNPSTNISIILFEEQRIDFDNRTVEGYMVEDGAIRYQPGVYPFPEAIYMRQNVSKQVSEKLKTVMGNKWFNTILFDKWKVWKILSKYQPLASHLPATKKLESKKDIREFLNQYKEVFLKPMNKHSSKGVFHLKKQQEGHIAVHYKKSGKGYLENFNSVKNLWKWISASIKNRSYLIQQGISAKPWNEKTTDIRMNMNKNRKGEWEITALFVRYTFDGTYIGCGSDVGVISLDSYLIQEYPSDGIDSIKKSIGDLGFMVCEALDKSKHHIGDHSIDLCIDEIGHPWIFEVNSRPHPFEYPIVDESWASPIEYAEFLAKNS